MGTLEALKDLVSIAVIASSLRMATPILYATLGGIFCSECGVLNVGLEGLMLIGAFFAVAGSVAFGNPWAGLLMAVISCLVMSLAFAAVHLELKADEMIVGLALNLFGYGLTTYLMTVIFQASGFFSDPRIIGFRPIRIPVLEGIPVLGPLLSGHFALVYLGFVAVALTHLVLYKTPWGFWLRAVGENAEAAEAVGVNVRLMKYAGVLTGGVLCGFSGAFISLAHLNLFSENMTTGRGFLALAAVAFGERKPWRCLLAALVFGFADAIAVWLQRFGLPSQLVLMLPYIATIVILALSSIQHLAATKARKVAMA